MLPSVIQPVNAKNAKMILGSQNPDLRPVQVDEDRIFIEVFPWKGIKLSETNVEIDKKRKTRRCYEYFRDRVMFGSERKIDVAWPSAMLAWIIPGCRPPFYQYWFKSFATKSLEGRYHPCLLCFRLKSVPAFEICMNGDHDPNLKPKEKAAKT
jgi:hypothetical protein